MIMQRSLIVVLTIVNCTIHTMNKFGAGVVRHAVQRTMHRQPVQCAMHTTSQLYKSKKSAEESTISISDELASKESLTQRLAQLKEQEKEIQAVLLSLEGFDNYNKGQVGLSMVSGGVLGALAQVTLPDLLPAFLHDETGLSAACGIAGGYAIGLTSALMGHILVHKIIVKTNDRDLEKVQSQIAAITEKIK